MCVTRIYCLRGRDGIAFRFKSRKAMVAYTRENHETPKTLPMISRTEFIKWKRRKEKEIERRKKKDGKSERTELTWVDSVIIPGMSILREVAS